MPSYRIDSVEAFCRALEELAGIKVSPTTIREHLREWCEEGVLNEEICRRFKPGRRGKSGS